MNRATFRDEILNTVSKSSLIYIDAHNAYTSLPALEFIHEAVSHVDEYIRGEVHTECLENFWSLLNRSLRGTYVAVEPFQLDRSLDEEIFRYNKRATKDNPLTDADCFALAGSQTAGKRLTMQS